MSFPLRLPLITLGSLLIGLASLRSLALPLEIAMPNMAHYLDDGPVGLWLHIALAPLALILLPFQFWQALRARRPALHRWIGRAYGVTFIAGNLGALAMLPAFTGSAFAAAGFGLLAVLSIGVTINGIRLAMARDVARHRAWMTRSAALCFAAVTLRIEMLPLIAAGWTVDQTYDVTGWLSWGLNLAVVEWWLRRARLHSAGLVA